jgi:CheY-like chemotaxis protein
MRHVLVVDDNATNLKLVSDVLEFAGMRVTRAEDAPSAEAVLEREIPDLVLMDIGLPGMSGLDLTRKLRANPLFDSLLIVALTAYAMKGDDAKAFDAGCDGYVTKPVNTRTLPNDLELLMERHARGPVR